MSLLNLLPSSKYGLGGKQPEQFDLGPGSTLDNESSLNNNPPFTTYKDAYLRGKMPTKQAPPAAQLKKYLDNPPQ
jgi:hypothetical protein